MSSPLDFVRLFREKLRARGIAHALTSGMACVHYGVQQLTKDSDWIIRADDISVLRNLLIEEESGLHPWRISYRSIFAAPLDSAFLRHGWTSHLSIWDSAESPEHHLDFFSKAPRVRQLSFPPDGWAERDTVARMKKTDRSKDWPIVNALGIQAAALREKEALLHVTDPAELRKLGTNVSPEIRADLEKKRPLLRSVTSTISDLDLERLIYVETGLWQMINKERHAVYQSVWKTFYRKWRAEEPWNWPTAEPFAIQHERVLKAARKFGLPENPFESSSTRERIFQAGIDRATALLKIAPEELGNVLPPIEEVLP
jgi:hypothetical protein